MEKGKVKKGIRVIVAHGKIFLRGVVLTIWGAAISGALFGGAYWLVDLEKESGYVAVLEFISAVGVLAIAAFSIYSIGIYAIGGKAGRRNGRA